MKKINSQLGTFWGAGVFFCLALMTAQAQTTQTIDLSPGDDIQAAVSAAPEGTTFVLSAGIYRMQSVEPKNNDVFSGQGQVILNGSQVLSFQSDPAGSGLWVAAATASTSNSGTCQSAYPLCGYNQDLFIDDVLQTLVASAQNLKPGSWYFDRPNNEVYLPINPDGHTVELGMEQYAFYGSAIGVQINSIIVEKYADAAQHGAIGGTRTGSAWIVKDVEVRWNHGAGIELGSGSQLLNSFIHHNGQLGIAFSGANCEAINNEISWNNYANYDTSWEAGGSKFWETTNLLVQSNYVHDNNGPGLWTDTDNVGVKYENNTVTHNLGGGIKHEVSYSATIQGNIVKGNGYETSTNWLWGAQITLQNSSNSEVFGNIVEVPSGGGGGIALINQNRGSGTLGPWVAANDSVHDNTITYLGSAGGSGIVDDTGGNTAVNNQFNNDQYILQDGGSDHWSWFKWMNWKSLQAIPQEAHGTCCS